MYNNQIIYCFILLYANLLTVSCDEMKNTLEHMVDVVDNVVSEHAIVRESNDAGLRIK